MAKRRVSQVTNDTGNILKARSKTGSSIFIISTDPYLESNSPHNTLEIHWAKWVRVPDNWRDNPYLESYHKRNQIELDDSPGMPEPAIQFPEFVKRNLTEFLRALIYGPYDNVMRERLEGMRNTAELKNAPHLQDQIESDLRPLMEAVLEVEPKVQNRSEVLEEAQRIIDWIDSGQWKQDIRKQNARVR